VLPDVNVLLALAWGNHEFHRIATAYFEKHEGVWHTCAV
jgi:predicted nucleic acid-binding protein